VIDVNAHYAVYSQTFTRWFQEFSDDQKNLLLLQLLVGEPLTVCIFNNFTMVIRL